MLPLRRRVLSREVNVRKRMAATDVDLEALRRRLRSGILPAELLKPGREVVLRSGRREISRDQLRDHAGEVAGGLRALGVEPGDRVGIYAPSSLEWVIAYVGAQRAGACIVPMNPDYHSAEVRHIVADADPALVITDAERAKTVEDLKRRTLPIDNLPRAAEPPMPPLTSDSPAAILYTSGTTGRPKGAVLDHGGLLAQARGAIEMWRWTSGDALVHALPLFHLHGLGMGLHGTLLSGGKAVLLSFTPEHVVHELTHGGTMLFGVPSMYQRLCEWLDENPTDLSHVRVFVCGS